MSVVRIVPRPLQITIKRVQCFIDYCNGGLEQLQMERNDLLSLSANGASSFVSEAAIELLNSRLQDVEHELEGLQYEVDLWQEWMMAQAHLVGMTIAELNEAIHTFDVDIP